MTYQQTREQSAEIFRQVIPLMAKQLAGCHPISFQMWYEYIAGINAALMKALDERLKTESPLEDEEVRRLHARFVLARDALIADQLHSEFGQILNASVQAANQTTTCVSQFEHVVQARSRQLEQATDAPAVAGIMRELLGEAHEVLRVTHNLRSVLAKQVEHVTSLRDRMAQTHHEAVTDSLSGLRNRRGFEQAIEEQSASGATLAGATLIVIDVDHFKQINDTHGHLVGDKVIRAVAGILRAIVKGRDVATRLGGEEFAVLLPDTQLAGAIALAEQIRSRVLDLRIRRGETTEPTGTVTASLGVAAALPDDSLESLIARADHALHAAKQGGRNRVCTSEGDAAFAAGRVD